MNRKKEREVKGRMDRRMDKRKEGRTAGQMKDWKLKDEEKTTGGGFLDVMAHAFNLSTRKAETSGSL